MIIENHSSNKNVILKHDPRRTLVTLNRKCYIEKCFKILETEQFSQLETYHQKPS